jgi:large subunit ribosomal protein L27
MAHTKSAGSTKYGRDSQPKYLGVKKHDGEVVKIGDILIRQRGTKYYSGTGVKQGRDDTLFSLAKGIVRFTSKQKRKFDGSIRRVTVVNIAAA